MRCFLIKEGRVVAVQELPGMSEQDAIEIGRTIFAETGDYDGLEIREDSRRIFRMGRVSRSRRKGMRCTKDDRL